MRPIVKRLEVIKVILNLKPKTSTLMDKLMVSGNIQGYFHVPVQYATHCIDHTFAFESEQTNRAKEIRYGTITSIVLCMS